MTGAGTEVLAHRVADAVLLHYGKLGAPLFEGQLAAVRHRPDGMYEIVLVSVADPRRGERVLLRDYRPLAAPAWADRSTLVVTAYRGPSGRPQLWRIDLASGRAGPFLTLGRGTFGASFSHDGQRVAFLVQNDAGGAEVWIANADGTEPRRLLPEMGRSRAVASDPVFTPSGEVVFSWDRDGSPLIWAATEGGEARRVFPGGPAQQLAPRVSVAGRIAFLGRSGGRFGIYVGEPGGESRFLGDAGATGSEPTWTNDGTAVAYFRSGKGGRELLLAVPDHGSIVRPVGTRLESPAWAPAQPRQEVVEGG